MSEKKVALVANSAFTVLNFRQELIREMVLRGYMVLIVCPPRCGLMNGRDIESEITKLGAHFRPVNMERNGTNPLKDIGYLKRLVKLFRQESPAYVLNYTIKPAIYSSLAARMAGVRVICSNITGIGYALTSSDFKGQLIGAVVTNLYRLALRFNKCVFFQNPDDKDVFVSKGLVDGRHTAILNGSGINTEFFNRSAEFPVDCSFIFVGRLLRDKGIFEFIYAAEKLRKLNSEVRFSIVGKLDDNPESLSQRDLQTLADKGVVNYLGSVPDVRPYLEEHQVLVLPSYREGTPRSVLEAMSMAMPVITTDAPGCRETVIDGSNGYIARVGDGDSLFECMKKMIDNQHLVKNMGLKSRQMAEQKYEVKNVVEHILACMTS